MEDCLDWCDMPKSRKVRFVKAELKGATRYGGIILRMNFIEPHNL